MNDTFMKTKPVFPLLVSMALPNVISMLVNSLYNIVDSLFVAQINEQAMTALSLVFPIQNFVNAVAIGFGIGINALVALYRGAGDYDRADTAATHGMALSVLHGILCTLAATAVMPGFLARFTADGTIVSMGVTYSTIVFLFATVNMASLAFEKLFQAVGRMKLTMIALISGCVCNILLDPVLIFGLGPVPAMGIAGAALATGIGQAATLVIYLVVYSTTESPVHLRRKALRPDLSLEGRLYAIGVPAILNLALPSLLVTFLNGLLAAFSESYVVVLGIYYKLQTFLYLPANGIVQGMRPLIGYNYGAKEHARVAKLYQLTLGMSAVIMAAGTVICMAASAPLIGLFSSNPETIAIGQTALRIICLGFVVSAVSTTSSGALEGLGKGAASLVISLCRYVIFIMPLAWLLCRQLGPTGVWHAFWVTEVLSAVIAFAVYRKSVINNKNNPRCFAGGFLCYRSSGTSAHTSRTIQGKNGSQSRAQQTLKAVWALAICREMTSSSGPLGEMNSTSRTNQGSSTAASRLPLRLKQLWASAARAAFFPCPMQASRAVTVVPMLSPNRTGTAPARPSTLWMPSGPA